MNKKLDSLLITAFLGFLIGALATSEIEAQNKTRNLMIINGPGAGTVIAVTKTNLVLPENNASTNASGSIGSESEPNCDCDHFHGSLNREDDPAPQACGWGCVAPISELSPYSIQIKEVIFLEENAAFQWQGNKTKGAEKELERSIDLLSRIRQHFNKSDLKLKRRQKKKLAKWMKFTEESKMTIQTKMRSKLKWIDLEEDIEDEVLLLLDVCDELAAKGL